MESDNEDSNHDINSNLTDTERFLERKSRYRDLLSFVDTLEEKKDLGLKTVADVGDIIRKVNSLEKEVSIEERVHHTDETILDCMVLSKASSLLVKCMNAVDDSSNNYEPTEFCNLLMEYLKEENEEFRANDLLKLLPEARALIPENPNYEYVYGTYDLNIVKVPKKKEKKIIKKDPKDLQKKEPVKTEKVDEQEDEIDEIVKYFHKVLIEEYQENHEEPINYYDYIIDTDDFSSTIENMFYFSFLIRDGKAKMDLDDKIPKITPMTKTDLKKFREEGGVNSQIITSISMEEWEKYKNVGFLQRRKRLANKS